MIFPADGRATLKVSSRAGSGHCHGVIFPADGRATLKEAAACRGCRTSARDIPGRWSGYVEGVQSWPRCLRGGVIFPADGRATLKEFVRDGEVFTGG